MPSRRRVDTGEIVAMLNAMLQLLSWQEQLVCSMLDQLPDGYDGSPSRSKPCRRKGKRRREGTI